MSQICKLQTIMIVQVCQKFIKLHIYRLYLRLQQFLFFIKSMLHMDDMITQIHNGERIIIKN